MDTPTRKAEYEAKKAEHERRGTTPGIAGDTWGDYERRCGNPELHESHEFGGWTTFILPGECPGRYAERRPWTPNTATVLTVKRCCNGCQRQLGDATDAEMDAAVEGRPLPDVRQECGCAPAR